jgi:predicted ATP-dependent serine protease
LKNEEEFQCSDCGATVPADANTCPNCGALLVDTEEEGDFMEMPVTSNPVDLSIIRSLLDKNRIKYFIKESPLNSVFGLPLGHTIIIMVRED